MDTKLYVVARTYDEAKHFAQNIARVRESSRFIYLHDKAQLLARDRNITIVFYGQWYESKSNRTLEDSIRFCGFNNLLYVGKEEEWNSKKYLDKLYHLHLVKPE